MKRFNTWHIILVCTLWILAFIWLTVCIGLSSQSGKETGELSTSIARFGAGTFNLPSTSILILNKKLRTVAHVVCFFVLSGLMGAACAVTFPARTASFSWPLLPCVLFAFMDEIHKVNIPGRHCSISEAWLNAAGCVIGCTVLGIILYVIRRSK